MATFYNQASLSYNGQVTNSNITEGEVIGVLSAEKIAITDTYTFGDTIVFILRITNGGNSDITNIGIEDDLGTYRSGDTAFTPLTYVDGSLLFFVNGVPAEAPNASMGTALFINGISIPANGSVLLIYEATVNEFAPLGEGASITNTAEITGACGDAEASATITAVSEVNLSVAKAISPTVITECGEVTYTFIIQNTGSMDVVATDDVILSDTFSPILHDITVTFNGEEWTEGTEYNYSEDTGVFTTVGGFIPVPGATYTRDPETGIVTTTPGVVVITVTGTL